MTHTLLLADDSVTIQRVIELTFADEDIRVITVDDGQQAVDRIEADRPDIVLADVGMPHRDGYEVAAYVKNTPHLAHIPVLLLTGAFEPVDEARAGAAGCDGVLAKPFEPQMVINRVKELLPGGKPRGVDRLSTSLPRASESSIGLGPAQAASSPLRGDETVLSETFVLRSSTSSGRPEPVEGRQPPQPARVPESSRHAAVTPPAPVRAAAPPRQIAVEDSADSEAPTAVFGTRTPGLSLDEYFDRLDAAFGTGTVSPALRSLEGEAADFMSAQPAPEPPPAQRSAQAASRLEEPAAVERRRSESARVAKPAVRPAQEQQTEPTSPAAEVIGQEAAPVEVPHPIGSSVASAFATLLSAERGEAIPSSAKLSRRSLVTSNDELVEQIARRVLDRLSDRQLVTDIVTRVTERVVREEIERLKSSLR